MATWRRFVSLGLAAVVFPCIWYTFFFGSNKPFISNNINYNNCKPKRDCLQFAYHMNPNWPPGKPRAAIYILVQQQRLQILLDCLKSIDKFFNNKYRYPIILFHEKDFRAYFGKVRNSTMSQIFFQEIEFHVPSFLTKPIPQKTICSSHSIGYRHMCRFHSKMVWEHPIMQNLDYYWRLDDDSRLLSPVRYDVFQFMQQNNFTYGYMKIQNDPKNCVFSLWKKAVKFAMENHLHFNLSDWPEGRIYYNNFEISSTDIWLSERYKRYFNVIDLSGGIFYYRWGDAPIKSLAVAMFVHPRRIVHFGDIGYEHQGLKNTPIHY